MEPRVGDHEDAEGVWRIREGVSVEFPPRNFEEAAAGYGSVAVAKAHQLTLGESPKPCRDQELGEASRWKIGANGASTNSGMPGGHGQRS